MNGLGGFLLVVAVLAVVLWLLLRGLGKGSRPVLSRKKPAAGLLRERPGEWRDAVYDPREFRRRR